jgi:hypothetical protein
LARRDRQPGCQGDAPACTELGKPSIIVRPGDLVTSRGVADWIRENPHIKVLNVAGNQYHKQLPTLAMRTLIV